MTGPPRVVESLCRAKSGDPSLCEDAVVVTEHHVAVIDGATDKTGLTHGGVLGGRWAADRLAEAVRALPADADARCVVERLTAALAGPAGPGADRPSASVAVFSVRRRQVVRVGDVSCHLLVGGVLRRHDDGKEVDRVAAEARRAVLAIHLARGATVDELRAGDPGRRAIEPVLSGQHWLRNAPPGVPLRWSAVDGTVVPPDLVEVVPVPADAEELILASDGYVRVLGTLQDTENELSRMLDRDPLCIADLLGTKALRPGHESFDDRAYVRVALA